MNKNKAIIEKFRDPNVYLMKGDWTKKDDQISKFLNEYDRSGIPFTLVFTPKQTKGIVLPEIVREKNLIEALSF